MVKDGGGSLEADEDYKRELEENEREMEEMRKSFEEKLLLVLIFTNIYRYILRQYFQAQADTAALGMKTSSEVTKQRAKYPHLYNLNADPQLSGMIVHIIKSGKYRIGKGDYFQNFSYRKWGN